MLMSKPCAWPALAAIGLLSGVVLAQVSEPGGRPRQRPGEPPPVLFFTPEIVNNALDRITEQMASHYKLDDDQLFNTRDVVKSRFPQFLQEHRDEITHAFNQYIAATLAGDPPTPEEVAEWAQRIQPLVQEFTELVDESADEIRGFMTEEQQLKLDGERAMYNIGVNHLKQRLQVWSEGGYDWQSEWPRSDAFRAGEAARRKQLEEEQQRARNEMLGIPPQAPLESAAAPAGAAPKPASPTTGPAVASNDEWSAYVESFIKRYRLDDAQQSSARKILRRLQEDRDKYLHRRASEIDSIEKRLKSAATDEERQKVRAEYEKINGPVERLYQQLKDKLDTLPTRKQRADAARSEIESRVTTEEKKVPEKKAAPGQ